MVLLLEAAPALVESVGPGVTVWFHYWPAAPNLSKPQLPFLSSGDNDGAHFARLNPLAQCLFLATSKH